MLTTPGRQPLHAADKENVGSQAKTPGKTLNPSLTPARRPLARLNQEAPTSQHRLASGKVFQTIWTPAEDGTPSRMTPARKTPSKKSKSCRKNKSLSSSFSCPVKRAALTITEAAESILNEVLLQEITDVSQHVQHEGCTELEAFSSTLADGDSQLEQTVTRLVEGSLQAALKELRNEQGISPPSLTHAIMSKSLSIVNETPTDDSLWTIALGLGDDSIDSRALLDPQIHNSALYDEFGGNDFSASTEILVVGEKDETCRMDATASEMAPFRLVNTSAGSTPTTSAIEMAYRSPGTTSVKVSDTSVSMATDTATDSSISITPSHSAEMINRAESMCPITLANNSTEITPLRLISKKDGCVMTTPINVADSTSMTTPIHLTDANYGTTPLRLTETSTLTTPVSLTDANTGTTPLKPVHVLDKSVMMTPTQLVDSTFGTTPIKSSDANYGTTPIKSSDANYGTTPIKSSDANYGTTPIKSSDANYGTTPIKSSNANYGTTPIKSSDANYGTTPIRLTHTSTATTPTSLTDASIGTTPLKPIEVLNKACMMTPIRTVHFACGTSPVESTHVNIGTTPVKSTEIGLCTDPVQVTDSYTGTTPVKMAEIAVGTRPFATADAQCGMTPVRVVDTRCGTTPYRTTDVGTAVTPLAVNTAETLTSPIIVPAFKLEADSPSHLDPAILRSHMESACISNELLRREIQTLKANQAQLLGQLEATRNQLEQREVAHRMEQLDQRVEVRQTAKASLQNEVDDLLLQFGEQMNQLAHLQEALDQKSAELTTAQQDQTNVHEHYQKEIHNLQQDLRTSYKQHQQQVTDLKTYYEQHDYESHYMRAMATITELRTELQVYNDLKETLDKAAQIQKEFGCIEEAYSLVNALFTRTMDKKDELDAQRMEMEDKMKEIDTSNKTLQDNLAIAEEQKQCLQTALDSALNAEKTALQCKAQVMRDLEEALQTTEATKMELHSTKLELFGLRDDYKSTRSRNKELHRQSVEHFLTESSLEAALSVQGSQWQHAAAKMETLRSEGEREMMSLKDNNTRLADEATDLRHRLSEREDLISSLQAELEDVRKSSQQKGKEMDSLKSELKTNRDARANALRMAHQIQRLQQCFKENTDFLEEERAALVEAAREAEDQLKVTTLELSRLKVALSQAEDTGMQWKSAAENLSDKLQFCQSELDNTKAQAHWMLLNQATEMRDAADGLTTLLNQIQDIYSKLNTGAKDLPVNKDASKTEGDSANTKTQPKTQKETEISTSCSLVASILAAVNSKDQDNGSQIDLQPPAQREAETPPLSSQRLPRTPSPSDIRPSIGGSSGSAFTTVQTSTNQELCTKEKEASQVSEGTADKREELPLSNQVEQVRALFGNVLQVILARNETLESSLQDVRDESCQLNSQLLRTQKQHDRELCLIRDQLRQSEMQERRLHQEVSSSQTSVAEQHQALQYAQHRLQAMADNLERFSDQKTTIEKLQTETAKLTSSLRVAQREKNHLQEQLDTILSSSSQSSSEGANGGNVKLQQTAVNSKLIKENLTIKKELEKLRVRLVERQEHYESVNARATRHVRVLEDNWHKADTEVYRLDELFDHCKQLIEKVPASSDDHANMAVLRELLR